MIIQFRFDDGWCFVWGERGRRGVGVSLMLWPGEWQFGPCHMWHDGTHCAWHFGPIILSRWGFQCRTCTGDME